MSKCSQIGAIESPYNAISLIRPPVTCRIVKSVPVKQGSYGHNSVPHCDTKA